MLEIRTGYSSALGREKEVLVKEGEREEEMVTVVEVEEVLVEEGKAGKEDVAGWRTMQSF